MTEQEHMDCVLRRGVIEKEEGDRVADILDSISKDLSSLLKDPKLTPFLKSTSAENINIDVIKEIMDVVSRRTGDLSDKWRAV